MHGRHVHQRLSCGRSIPSLDPMSSIGLIFKCEGEADELEAGFVPIPLGSRSDVLAAIADLVPTGDPTLGLLLDVESASENPQPRTISVSGVWADREMSIIR